MSGVKVVKQCDNEARGVNCKLCPLNLTSDAPAYYIATTVHHFMSDDKTPCGEVYVGLRRNLLVLKRISASPSAIIVSLHAQIAHQAT